MQIEKCSECDPFFNLQFVICNLQFAMIERRTTFMDLARFLQQRRPDWKRLEEILQRIEGSGLSSLDDEQSIEFGRLYRRAASDLNQAQTFVSDEATERYLNDLVARAYLAIYGKTRIDVLGLLRYLFWGYPAVFRRYLPHFLLATLLFMVGTTFGYL